MNLHDILKPYEYNQVYYRSEGYNELIRYLLDYTNAHSWFHYYGTIVHDSDGEHYFHYAVVHWTEGHRPTINTFNFIRIHD